MIPMRFPHPLPSAQDFLAGMVRVGGVLHFTLTGGAPREPVPVVPVVMTLDLLAREPAKATALSPEERRALIVQAAAVLAALGGTLALRDDDAEPDSLLTVEQAAARLSLSTDYLYKNAKRLPFFVEPPAGANVIRFSARGIARYLAEKRRAE